MKKDTLFFAYLSLLAFCGMLFSNAQAQETTEIYPVSIYGLTTVETAPEHPAGNWTEFQLPKTSNARDTLNKLYLRPGSAPVDIEQKYDENYNPIPVNPVDLNAIGFDFPYGGRKMTHFGVTGNGLIYLGAGTADNPDAVQRSLIYTSSISALADVVAAVPQADVSGSGYPSEPYFVVDGQTKVGYYQDPDKKYLMVSFRDLLVGFTVNGQPWATPPTEDKVYDCRWTYDVILHQDGRIMLRFVEAEMPASDSPLLYFAYGLFGLENESAVFVDQTGKAQVVEPGFPSVYMTMAEEVKGTVWTYTAPQACTAPQGVTAEVTVEEMYATDFKATLEIQGTCDGWLAFVSDNHQVDERPEDGKTYSTGNWTMAADKIGGNPVKIAGTEKEISATGLASDATCYIYVYPYNAQCLGGPVYQQEPVKIPVTTAIGGPAVETAAVTETSATFNFPGLAADARILVGIARRDYRNEANGSRYEIAGISGKAYAIGDTLFFADPAADASAYSNQGPYCIEAVHVGTVADGALTISDLEPATPYYFYFWTALAGENQYSKEYVETSILTTPTTPYTFTFATDRAPIQGESGILPAGWSSSSEGMNASFQAAMYQVGFGSIQGDPNERRALGVRLASDNPAVSVDVVRADVITPAFRSSHSAFDVRYRVQMQSSGMISSNLSQLGSEDSLTVWYRVAGQNDWKLAICVTNSEPWEYAADNFAALKATVRNVPQNQDIQLRFMIRATPAGGMMSTKIFALHHVVVEPHLNCAYPENIAVFDSLTTHRTLGLSWQDENTPAASVVYRYRLAGTETWSSLKAAQLPTACAIRPLQAHTAYEVALQAVCKNGDSSLVKTVTGTTLRGLPYQQALTDLEQWPADMEAETGTLPAEGSAETGADMYGVGFAVNRYSAESHTAAGISFNVNQMQEAWLKLPVLCLEDMPAPAELTFQYKAFYRENGNGEPVAVDAESPFRVLVLVSEDGAFSRADSVGELRVKDMKTDYQTYTIDLSAYTRQIHVALYAENPDQEYGENGAGYARRSNTYFIVDSLEARYTADIPCYAVEDINQYGLTATGVTLSWTGYSVEYGIILTNEDQGVTDTVYTAETTCTLTDLEPGTLYTYRIQAYCEDGHRSPSALSEEGFFTTRDVCAVPADFAVLGTTWQSVTITAKSSGSRLIHVWGKEEAFAHLEYEMVWEAGRDTLTLKGLFEELHVTYCIALRNVCAAGDSSAWTQPLEFTTDIPECGAPTGLKCGRVGADYADLSWTAGKNNDYFNLMYRPSTQSRFDTLAVAKTDYRLSDLKPGTAYVWQLQAVCDQYLISAAVKGADFTTEGVAVERTSRFAGLRVGVENGRIAIWNADALPIDRVEVYSLNGRTLYAQDFRTTEHLWLPVLEGAHMVLVRVFSAGETAVYKIVLL